MPHPRPPITHILLWLVIVLLSAISFSFALVSTTSPGRHAYWVGRSGHDDSDPPQPTGYRYWRSPFSYCEKSPNGAFNCTRVSVPGQLCSVSVGNKYNVNRDSPQLCAALTVAGRLLIAGSVLLGVGLAVSLVIAARHAVSLRRQRRYPKEAESGLTGGRRERILARFEAALQILLLLTAPAGAVCIVVAELTGGWGLLVWQFPNGEAGTQDNIDVKAMWTPAGGMSYAAVSWILGGFASLIIVAMADLRRAITALEFYWGPQDEPEGENL